MPLSEPIRRIFLRLGKLTDEENDILNAWLDRRENFSSLVEACRDPDRDLRSTALFLLFYYFRHPTVVETLLTALADPDPQIPDVAMGMLKDYPRSGNTPEGTVNQVLEESSNLPALVRSILIGSDRDFGLHWDDYRDLLNNIDVAKRIPALSKLLGDADNLVGVLAASEIYGLYGSDRSRFKDDVENATLGLLQALDDPEEKVVRTAIFSARDERFIPGLVQLLISGKHDLRKAAAEKLSESPPGASLVEEIRQFFLGQRNRLRSDERVAIAECLVDLGDATGVLVILDHPRGKDHIQMLLRRLGVAANWLDDLASQEVLADGETWGPLDRSLGTDDTESRRATAFVLARLGSRSPGFVAYLSHLQRDPHNTGLGQSDWEMITAELEQVLGYVPLPDWEIVAEVDLLKAGEANIVSGSLRNIGTGAAVDVIVSLSLDGRVTTDNPILKILQLAPGESVDWDALVVPNVGGPMPFSWEIDFRDITGRANARLTKRATIRSPVLGDQTIISIGGNNSGDIVTGRGINQGEGGIAQVKEVVTGPSGDDSTASPPSAKFCTQCERELGEATGWRVCPFCEAPISPRSTG